MNNQQAEPSWVRPKDHVIAQAINQLRDIAIQFHDTEQLRERIKEVVLPLINGEPLIRNTEDMDVFYANSAKRTEAKANQYREINDLLKSL